MSFKYFLPALVALIVVSTIVVPDLVPWTWSTPKPLPSPEQVIAPINTRLELVELVDMSGAEVLAGSPATPRMTLGLRPKKGQARDVIQFGLQEYWIETGGSFLEDPVADLFQEIEKIANQRGPIVEALKKGQAKLEILGVGVELTGEALVEILYALGKLAEIDAKAELKVYIKGFADGTKNSWSEKLIPEYDDGIYQKFYVHYAARRNSLNPRNYEAEATRYEVWSEYTNDDLPNLRARFIEQDILLPYLEQVKASKGGFVGSYSTHLLDGYVFSGVDEERRRVEIVVEVY